MYCSRCGATIAEGAAFCTACGQPTHAAAAVSAASPGSAGPAARPPMGVAYPSPYAGFWLRFVAHLIDSLIIGVPFFIIFGILFASAGLGVALGHLHEGADVAATLVPLFVGVILPLVAISLVGGWLYYALMESSSWQATLGKKALNLQVTDLAGHRVSFGRASGRHFAKIISGLIPFAIGYIMAGFTEKKQALHDMIASCLVIRKA